MNVVVVSAEFPPLRGGISTFAWGVGRSLAEAGHRVRVITCVGPAGTEQLGGLEVTRATSVLSRRFVKMLPLLAATLRAARRERPDVLLCMKVSHEGLPALLVGRLLGVPYVAVVHGSEVLRHGRAPLRRAVIRRLLDGAANVIVNSRHTRTIVAGFGRDVGAITVVNPPLDTDAYAIGGATSDVEAGYGLAGRRVILTVGQLAERKGHAEVIRALATLRDRYPDLTYVIVGGAGRHRSHLEQLVRELGLAGRVIFTGYLDSEPLQQLYRLCEVFVMPSREIDGDIEGFGIGFIEANLFGKPVIGGRSGGIGDAVVHGETGVLVDPAEVESLSAALVALLDDAPLRARLGQAGRDRVLRELTLAAARRPLEAALADAVERARRPRAAVARTAR